MTEMTEYAPGTPSWVDLGSPDIEASVAFYEGLFGWQIPESPNAEQTGAGGDHHTVGRSTSRSVALRC